MKKVICFEPDYNTDHQRVLRAFASGIPGATVRPVTEYEPCDIAVIFGGVKKAFSPTHQKQAILDRHRGRSLIMIDAGFLKRDRFYQVAWGGIAGHGDFNTDRDLTLDRWNKLEIPTQPFRTRPLGPVVVVGQLPRDVQVQNTNHIQWCRDTFNHYRKAGHHTLFRPHPKVVDRHDYGIPLEHMDLAPLDATLNIARCMVTFNSTTAVESVVAGVPTIAVDSGSMAYSVTERSLDRLDTNHFRQAWLARLGYSQWTVGDMRRGETWKNLNAK